MMDTGADSTSLMPIDTLPMGVNFDSLNQENLQTANGIGGSCDVYAESALVIFIDREDKKAYVYRTTIGIIPKEDNTENLPSLLGRDIMKNWIAVFDQTNKTIGATVRSSSQTITLGD